MPRAVLASPYIMDGNPTDAKLHPRPSNVSSFPDHYVGPMSLVPLEHRMADHTRSHQAIHQHGHLEQWSYATHAKVYELGQI